MLVISWFICGMLYFLLYSYLFSKLICKNDFKINNKVILLAIIMASINCMVLYFDTGYLKPYIMHFVVFLELILLFRKSFSKTLIALLYILLIVCFSEFICSIFLMLIGLNPEILSTSFVFYILINIIILIISIILFKIKFILKLFSNIIKWYDANQYKSLIFFVIMVLTINVFLLYNNFISILSTSLLLLTNLFCIAVFVFVIGFFKEKTNNNKIIYEYDQLLDYVKVYERLLEEKSKNQHEYKNQLIIIRDTPKKKDRNKYINNILNVENSEDDSEWLRKLKYIPQGGLKGLIYYKIQIMLKNNINVLLSVSEELKETKVWKNFDKNLSDISKIIGVYLDNAIEATSNINEKYITISVYLENNEIVFDITNTYSGEIDVIKIDKEGYSTKGEGKGYGLSLVKDIISKNDKLEQKRIINGNYYTQQLYIKK